MPDFYFLVRFLAHKDVIVRNRIADFFIEHRINDDAIPPMVIRAVQSFGISENLYLLRLLPYQDLNSEQIKFFLAQREKILELKKSIELLRDYDIILKRILITRGFNLLKPSLEEFPPDILKVIYLKKWKQIIHRDLYKIYSCYPIHIVQNRIHEFVNKNKRKTIKRSYLSELRIWTEVFYVNFSEMKRVENKKLFFESTENYFKNLTKNALVSPVKRKVYSLEAYYHLLNASWWSMDHLLTPIMDIFTVECDEFVYKETINRLLEFDKNKILGAASELLMSQKVTDKAFPHFLKLFYLPGEFEDKDFCSKSEVILLSALEQEKHFARKVQLALTLSNLFSPAFFNLGSALLKNKGHFNFSVGTYGKYRLLLQERLLVHSLLTGEKVEGLENYSNSYVDNKFGLIGRFNSSLFFHKKNDQGE